VACPAPRPVRALVYDCERAAIRRLDRAFRGFFRRIKAGHKPGYPRFKGRDSWDSIQCRSQERRSHLNFHYGPRFTG
jgi:hypothetical protein